MSTRIVMALSAVFLAVVGLVFTFMPHEILGFCGVLPSEPLALLLQVGGAALVGWGLVNWTARGLLVGGIYSRPLTLGNLVNFVLVTLALGKGLPALAFHPVAVVALIGYGIFAACFGYLVFGQGAACVQANESGG